MKLPKLIIFISIMSLISCAERSSFINDCECDKAILNKGIRISSNSNRFSVVYPDSTWQPVASEFQLNGGIINGKSFKYFGINETRKAEPWMTLDEQQKDIEERFNVIESGVTDVYSKKSIWNLVEKNYDTIPTIGLYITVEHPNKDFFYTLALSVSKDKYGVKEICELENIFKSFETRE